MRINLALQLAILITGFDNDGALELIIGQLFTQLGVPRQQGAGALLQRLRLTEQQCQPQQAGK